MKIGITGPIWVDSLKDYLFINESNKIHLTKGLGGTAINHLVKGLLDLGHEVSIYTLDFDVETPIRLHGENLNIYIGHYRTKGRMLDFFSYEANQIRDFINDDIPDIISAHWSYEFALGALKTNIPHLITFHDNAKEILKLFKDPYRFVRFMMDFYVRKKGDNFSVISPYLGKSIKVNGELPVIPAPMDEKYIKDVNESKILPQGFHKIKILTVINGWSELKNPTTAVKGFQLYKELYSTIPVEYHFYGKGCGENDPSYKWIKDNNLEKDVYLHGALPYEQLMNTFSEYDILLHPSLEESFGYTIIEAMANGLPVIGGNKSGAVPWILNEGKNGILVDVREPESIASGLNSLIGNKKLYDRLSKEGIKRVRDNFAGTAVAQQYVELFNKILEEV